MLAKSRHVLFLGIAACLGEDFETFSLDHSFHFDALDRSPVADPLVQRAFGDGVQDLLSAHIPVDAPLGKYQIDARPDGTRTPYPGGPGTLGVFNAVAAPWDPTKGYVGQLPHGSSFIQVVQFNGTGCPDARTILTYSQSPNPKSPHYADQTKLFSQSKWATDHFCEKDVAKATLTTLRLTA